MGRRQVHVARVKLLIWIIEAERSGLRHLVRLAGTIHKHMNGILEYIRTGLNNGRAEGLNGKTRTITRRAYGFHNARSLIAMIFLCCGGVQVSPAHSYPKSLHE